MKLNKILMAFAAMAMVGCSSEDLNDFSASQAPEDSRLIQLDENFAIAGVGVDDATTRTHWEQLPSGALVNKFLPILNNTYVTGDILADKVYKLNQSVGFCWLNETVTENVYTNYQFYHYGWLKKGEDGANIECEKLTNGAWYNEIKFTAGGGGDLVEADEANFGLVDPAGKGFAIGDLDWNSGVYKTENAAIFGGDYIVYYPYNEDFNKIGTIPAKAVTNFAAATNDKTDTYLGDATFRYSRKTHIDGGAKASGFKLYNLSALVNLRVQGNSGGKIDRIVLRSKKEQLLEQANLAADKIVAGKEGKELYADTKGTKTIVATLAGPAASTLPSPAGDVSTYITALPATVEDLEVYVHRQDGKWATKTIGEFEFLPGRGQVVHISVASTDFKTQYYAVDYATLVSALTEAAGKTATIEVIGDITLAADLNINEPNITIKGDKIIVPENVTLTLNTKMESDVRVLGKACCTDPALLGGRLEINGGTLGNVTMEPAVAKVTGTTPATYENYNPMVTYVSDGNPATFATIAAEKKFDVQAGTVVVNDAVQHKGDFTLAEGATLTVNGTDEGAIGDLNFMGATVVNNGTIEVKKAGNFDMTDAKGNATATDGQHMTNNYKFIHNVDAEVGTAVQSMVQNGEYRCRVNDQIKLDDAFLQWTACSVIEMVNPTPADAVTYNLGTAAGIKPTAYKHNGKFINIEVNTPGYKTTFDNSVNSDKGDDKNIGIGDLTVTDGTLDVKFAGTEKKRKLTVHGDMTVKATTTLTSSQQIIITDEDANGENKGNLTVQGSATLTYAGGKANVEGLAVTKDIKVHDGVFDASAVDALDITCANFYLVKPATAIFGNRTDGAAKNMTVSGIIDNPKDCIFEITAASGSNVLGWVTCTTLKVGGKFPGSKPKVVN